MAEDYRQTHGNTLYVKSFQDITVASGHRDENGFLVRALGPGDLVVKDLDGNEHTFTFTAAGDVKVTDVPYLACSEIVAAGSTVTTCRIFEAAG